MELIVATNLTLILVLEDFLVHTKIDRNDSSLSNNSETELLILETTDLSEDDIGTVR